VHRFNRSQQDGFLPYVEDGTVTLVGATTENPSFELNAALLSRCQVLILRRLDHQALEELIRRAEGLEQRIRRGVDELRKSGPDWAKPTAMVHWIETKAGPTRA